ncbi:MAG: recombinase RecT, partial [Candidatus Omnitrophica bacterium]|nr:recombinase RecT [Candidatus Omnitrophota bacterium]MBU1785279.1 recombinase RecT [Candidatus Omnitrophota bacterium]MBU1852382.1 recombinase RecT [Candidatus Omnitrophota bacterium]
PFKTTCQLMIGYQGMLDIARRSGLVTSIWGHVVREGDYFEWELGLEPKMVHKPSNLQDREDKAITHVYAAARMKGGDTIFDVLTKAQVDKRRKRSRASGSGPWVTDYEAMAVKTAVRALWKWLPKSAEMAKAAAIDEAPEIGEQSDAWDAEVTEALEKEGIAAEVDITDGEFVNEETGEVLS